MANVQVTARNSVLTNSDLLHCIFTFVPAPLPYSLVGRDNLHHLAPCVTVCHAFHEPAIRILWRKLSSLFPLWHLLAPPNSKCPPYNFLKDQRSDYLYQIISAQRYDDPIVWDRFLWHAARVRDICLSFSIHNSHAETSAAQLLLIHAIILQNGGKTVLPSLRSIKWQDRAPADGSLIPFFTSTLRHATFSFACPPDEMPHVLLLRRLRECSPFLQTLDISPTLWDKDNVDVGPQLLQEVLRFDRLGEIKIYRITGPVTFRNLIAKPNLVSLTIYDVTGPWVGLSSQPPDLAHDLRTLSVSGTGPALAAFFGEARFIALESATLNVYVSTSPDSDPTEDIADVVAAFCNAVTPASHLVRSLDIYIWGSPSQWDTAVGLRNLVAPVLQASFCELRSFSFGAEDLALRIEDATIEALVGAWPKLKHLCLDCDSPSDNEALSIHALHHIHAHCHRLEKLVVREVRCPVVGVQVVPEPLDRPSPHPLRHMSVDRRPVPAFGRFKVSDEAAEAVARYVLELFPAAYRREHKRTSDQATPLGVYKRIFFDRW